MVPLDPKLFAGRVDALGRIELGRPDPHVDVGQEAAEHEHAIGRLDQLGDLRPSHRPLVDAGEERVRFGDHALAQDRRRDRHARRFGQGHQVVLQAEPVDLDVGENDRPAGSREQLARFVDRLAQRVRVAGRKPLRRAMRADLLRLHLVSRQLEIDRPLVANRRLEHPVDLAERRFRPIQHRPGPRDLLKHLELRLEAFDLVVQQRVVRPLGHPRRAPQNDHRRLLGIGAGDAVARGEPSDTISHADAAQPVNPRVRIGREARVVFPGHADQLDRAFIDQLVKREDVIARDAEDMLDAQCPQALDQVFADRDRARSGRPNRPRFRRPSMLRYASVFLESTCPTSWSPTPNAPGPTSCPPAARQRSSGPRAYGGNGRE